LETYSFFSFLFEHQAATFGAEYEFNFVNKTPDGALVFSSKTDLSTPTIILLEEATPTDENLLGVTLSSNLHTMSNDLDKFISSFMLAYVNKDLVLYISLDEPSRTLTINSASLKSNTQSVQSLNFNTGYLIEGNEIIFDEPLERTILGNAISITGLHLNDLTASTISICAEPITLHTYTGVTSANDAVVLETGLFDVNGASFANVSDFYFSPLVYILDNGRSANTQIAQDIAGALELHMYYGYNIGGGELLYGIGFVIRNVDESVTFALRKFTPALTGNQITFNFEPKITLYGNTTTTANTANINIYLDALTQGNNTYVFKLNDGVYEFHNPCTGWSFVLIDAN
jgi:hypothetical protein